MRKHPKVQNSEDAPTAGPYDEYGARDKDDSVELAKVRAPKISAMGPLD